MTNPNYSLSTAATLHAKLRDWLIKEEGLDEDDQCLADSLEGLSDFSEMVAAIAREARYEEAQAEACKAIIKEIQDRKARREAKAERLRAAIVWALEEAGEKKITAPDMTLTLSKGKRRVVTLGEPNAFTCERFVTTKTEYRWNKDELAKGLEQGDPAAQELASFSNGGAVLTIRTR